MLGHSRLYNALEIVDSCVVQTPTARLPWKRLRKYFPPAWDLPVEDWTRRVRTPKKTSNQNRTKAFPPAFGTIANTQRRLRFSAEECQGNSAQAESRDVSIIICVNGGNFWFMKVVRTVIRQTASDELAQPGKNSRAVIHGRLRTRTEKP